jgi:mRNA-degrading endonuclease RelE of RelBE toxin-antitoxin system
MKYEIIFTYSFKRQLKKFKKKYPLAADDLKPLLICIEEGELPGDPIPGLLNKVFKARCASSDMKRGKSGDYRVIYYLQDQDRKIYLLSIYSKAERENIPVDEILQILKELGLKLKY